MSFLKHEPPNPRPAFRNLEPRRESRPIALAISSMSAPVRSQIELTVLILLIRCASMAFATNLESSEDQRFTVTILERSTHAPYTSSSVAAAARPASVRELPIRIRSGLSRSLIAVPSARNSGFERISNGTLGLWASSCRFVSNLYGDQS